MPEVVDTLLHLPTGAHCVSFHASREEAADHAIDFLRGTPGGMPARYWVPTPALAAYDNERLAEVAPAQVGCVQPLAPEQVEWSGEKLRPAQEIRAFVTAHAEGVTGGADTISMYWGPENVAEHLEYEAWFQDQPRDASRFLCPYDLRTVPAGSATSVLRELGRHHTHAVLSESDEPAVRLLQLFIFGTEQAIPPGLRRTHGWARRTGLLRPTGPDEDLALTQAGQAVVEAWSEGAAIDW